MLNVDLMAYPARLHVAQRLAREASDAGFHGIAMTEVGRTPYQSLAAMALSADLDYCTAIAVAFPLSPMVTAQNAWELAQATNGRFRLGLGTQVRAHIARRYSADFDHPGPRMREYVLAVKAIFAAFQGREPLHFSGDHYNFSLLPEEWSPGPIEPGEPPVDVAGVNPWMIRMAGGVADGLHVHPLNTTDYLDGVVAPALRAGADAAGRSLTDITVVCPCFAVAGDSDAEREHWRDRARAKVAFYGSTPNYAFIFDRLGHEGTTDALRARLREGDIDGASKVVTDEILEHFVVEGTWSSVARALVDRYAGRAQRVVLYDALGDWPEDRSALANWGAVAADVARLTSG